MAAVEFAAAGLATHEKADCTLGPERQIRILSVSPDEGDHSELLHILDELPFHLHHRAIGPRGGRLFGFRTVRRHPLRMPPAGRELA